MIEENLPSSWVLSKLGEIGQIVSGGTPSTTVSEYWGGDISWISPVDLSKYEKKLINKGAKSITELGLLKSSAKLMPVGAVLFSSRAPIGYVAIAGAELCTNQGFKSIVPNNSVFNEYLYYFLKSAKKQADDLASGTTFKEISLTNFAIITIPLPPIAEQHRIVAKIEELFSDLDKGIETLKTAKDQLKVYRQAVLKYAFEGRLTNPDLSVGELPEGWLNCKSGDVMDFINSGSTPSSDFMSDNFGEVPFLKVYNLNFDGTLNHKKNPVFITMEVHKTKMKRSICLPNDVLINIVGPPLGKVSVVSNHYPEWNINQAIVAFRPNEKIRPKYLAYQLQNQVLIQWLENTSKATAGQWNVKVSTCREIPIRMPEDIFEQDIIVQEIESRLSTCDKILESIEHGLQQAEALRQSILKRAFEGKLVPQDPNDEPAHVLLERIKRERAAAQPVKKEKKAKS